MFLTISSAMLAMGAQSQQGQQGQAPPGWMSFAPLALLMVIFYFALIRPQQTKTKKLNELLKSIRPGDKVLTSGGIIAVVITVKEKSLSIRSADSKFEITKSAVIEITERSGESSES